MKARRLSLVFVWVLSLLALAAILTLLGAWSDAPPLVGASQAGPGDAPHLSPAAELRVCADCLYTNVQAAVDAASGGDVIKIAAGAYTGVQARAGVTQVVYIAKSLSLQGGYTPTNWVTPNPASYPATLDAGGLGRVIYITAGVTVTLDGLRILNGAGDTGGGIWSEALTLTIRNSTVASSAARSLASPSFSKGGGIYSCGGDLVVENSRIVSNSADYDGGGVYAAAVTLQNVELLGNRSGENGGAVCSYYGPVAIRNSDFVNNAAWDNDPYDSNNGGALHIYGGSVAVLEGSTFVGNTADGFAGGVYARETTLSMTRNLFQDNSSQRSGGGAFVYECSAYADYNTFERNTAASSGGGLEATWGDLVLTRNSFLGNTGGSYGGGGFYGSGIAAGHAYTVTHNLFQGNVGDWSSSAAGGGANISAGDGWVVFSHNQALNNVASAGPTGANGGLGGGAAIVGPALIADNLFQGNWACSAAPQGGYYYGGRGGGLSLMGQGVRVERNRFFYNRAARNAGINYTSLALGGGVYVATNAAVTMTNNIFAGNVFCEECAPGELQTEWFRGGAAVAVQGSVYAAAPDTHAVLWHNTIADNQVSAVRNEGAAVIAMSHNLLAGHATGLSNARRYDYVCPTTTADYTLWWPTQSVAVRDADGQCSAPLTSHDFVGDPDWASAALDGYHLGSGSQAIDRGPGIGVSSDIDGNPRPIGAGYDLGADEYVNVDLAPSHKTAIPSQAGLGDVITFAILLRNSGLADALSTTLFDAIPLSTTYVAGSAQASSGLVADSGGIGWTGNVPSGGAVTVTFQVTVNAAAVIKNTAVVTDVYGATYSLSAWLNARRIYLPLVLK